MAKNQNPSESIKAFGIVLMIIGILSAVGLTLVDIWAAFASAVSSIITGLLIWFWGRSVEVTEQIRDILKRRDQQ